MDNKYLDENTNRNFTQDSNQNFAQNPNQSFTPATEDMEKYFEQMAENRKRFLKNKRKKFFKGAPQLFITLAVIALVIYLAFFARLFNPSEKFIIRRLSSVSGVTQIEALDLDAPKRVHNKNFDFTSCVYFSYSAVDQDEIIGSSVVDKGTICGGCIEAFKTRAEAKERDEHLSESDNTLFDSGSHKVVGTMVIRTSGKLSNASQEKLEKNIILAFMSPIALSENEYLEKNAANESTTDSQVEKVTEQTDQNGLTMEYKELCDRYYDKYTRLLEYIPDYAKINYEKKSFALNSGGKPTFSEKDKRYLEKIYAQIKSLSDKIENFEDPTSEDKAYWDKIKEKINSYESDYENKCASTLKFRLQNEKPEQKDTSNNGEVSADFKKIMDDYEAFFNNYVDFMKRYENAGDEEILGMMSDYMDMLSQYSQMLSDLQSIDRQSLSVADAAYYAEVYGRILKKLGELS